MLYVPCTTPPLPGTDVLSLDFVQLTDGRMALPTYSALDRLIDGCGPDQPWVVLPSSKLEEIGESAPYDVILLDVPLPEDVRRRVGG